MRKRLLIFLFTCACTYSQAQVNDIITIAGTDSAGFSGDNGPAKLAKLKSPYGLCFDNFSNLYIADAENNRVRKINLSSGIITTVAGKDSSGYSGDGGAATNAELLLPTDVFTDSFGNIFISDYYNIRKITTSTGIITTVAGNGMQILKTEFTAQEKKYRI